MSLLLEIVFLPRSTENHTLMRVKRLFLFYLVSENGNAGGINDNVENNNQQREMVATASGSTPRRVRLFGVNLECPDESEPSTPDSSSQGTTGQPHYQYYSNSNNMVRYMYSTFVFS